MKTGVVFYTKITIKKIKMRLPPYEKYPGITGDKVSLRQIQIADMNDRIEISFYDAIQATTLQQATEMLDRINND
jgi:[ribosomal protein S5]-alanine N-acetyltransferase